MSTINPWFPEPDILIHQVLGKMAEECNELAKIAVRCMIQGINESDPGTQAANRTELLKEIADVEATICWAFEVITFDGFISERQRSKLEGFHRWQKMLEEHKPYTAKPVGWQSNSENFGWVAIDPVDIKHYLDKGTAVRPIFAGDQLRDLPQDVAP